MLTGQAIYVSAVVRKDGEVLAIAPKQLKEVVTEEPALCDIFLKAFLARRSYAMRVGVGLRIAGSRHSSDATRLREFAARNRLPLGWVELEEDPEAEALLEGFGAKPSEAPVAIWQGEDVLKNPTNAELARTIGLEVDAPPWNESTTSSWLAQGRRASARQSTGLLRASLPSPSSRWPWGGRRARAPG
jgi:thioredoxin reductase (NADPH)